MLKCGKCEIAENAKMRKMRKVRNCENCDNDLSVGWRAVLRSNLRKQLLAVEQERTRILQDTCDGLFNHTSALLLEHNDFEPQPRQVQSREKRTKSIHQETKTEIHQNDQCSTLSRSEGGLAPSKIDDFHRYANPGFDSMLVFQR